jgi:PPOX class probable F420-dependent enzyme
MSPLSAAMAGVREPRDAWSWLVGVLVVALPGYYVHPMDLDEARDVIREQHRAVLATVREDGTPQMSPVVVAVDEAGRVLVSTRETAMKVHNLRRDPRLWLCVLADGFFGRWVQVEGRAEIVSLPEAMEGLVDYYRRVAGEHDDWDDYRAAMQRERRVLVRVALDRAGPDRAG